MQVKSVLTKKLQEKNQELDAASETTIKNQIIGLAKKDSAVRLLMWKRLLAYVRLVKGNKTTPPVPPGFAECADELQSLANTFKRITIYNYSVFGEQYEKILDKTVTTADDSIIASTSASSSASSSAANSETNGTIPQSSSVIESQNTS